MNTTLRLNQFVTGFFIATILTVGSAGSFGKEPTAVTAESIVELLQKRQLVLSQLVRVQTEAYRNGETGIESVVQARQQLLLVKLELATSHEERIKLLERSIKLASELEKLAEAKHKSGNGSAADILSSQSDRLKVEIRLVRERQKKKQG
ncbi:MULTISPECIES: TolC family protein [Gimesia]|jgi:outer membrane protein TolC|uniref:Uncharacterized protein n=2 Tax=Gimesia TaxID=1649453 RepID=A0A6I6AM49_9PLAN|nr:MULTISPECIES: TolC family protein [Gimesia]MAC54524.1 hypothetical protein [Gimesia sp.]MBP69258.1 hypothetical protein [Haliea sp.]HAW32106.1 hypothetical protein [Planctomycetaceae bacterium]QDT22001.1 Outer membrane efflux protein [Gimesia chilikensis]QGQ26201.1 hypothetical protein F1728_27520 [Gimesia benthica]|tara:strand:+ start:2882 stop:3331 length:450 start_codon:yes stop_codon:yes gene_type:complete